MNTPRANRRNQHRLVLLAALLGSLLLPGGDAAASGVCATAEIVEPFRLPDGSLQGPARLTLCDRGEYSPVASFHEVRVDGTPVGLLTGRNDLSEHGSREASFVMFLREADGRLTLLGYALPTRDGMRTFEFRPQAKRSTEHARRDPATQPTVLLAARLG